ncbi:hypothetical protein L4C36_19585 [Photobacterium japonica]|uniref:hypothetical protein n=1 Tax=Photobacterium japonica TaxID=2910235 RepID=UPI003D14139B
MMTLIQAALTVPAHMLPGGIHPQAVSFGFKELIRTRTEHNTPVDLVTFTFSSPQATANEDRFDQALEHFLWHLAKGTPYQVDKSFINPAANECQSYHYQDNALTMRRRPLRDILSTHAAY